MELLIEIGKLLGGLVVLLIGADLLVRGSSKFAVSLGVKPVVVGLTLVAYGTSAPELTVSVDAALKGSAGVSLGNVVGSNIGNIGLILGLVALVKPVPFNMELFRRDIPVMLGAAVMLGVLPFIGGPEVVGEGNAFILRRWMAGIFLVAMLLLQVKMIRGAGAPEAAAEKKAGLWRMRGLLLLMALAGLAALIAGGMIFVSASVAVAKMAGISELVIGLTIVAVGTSLPELAASAIAAMRGHSDLASGNIVGSNIFNILFVLGVASMISPIPIEARAMQFDIPVMLGFSILLVVLIWRKKMLTRLGGGILVGLYALYVTNLIVQWV